MKGAIGSYLSAAAAGVPAAKKKLRGVFTEDFQTPHDWRDFLDANIPMWDVETLLGRKAAWWHRENFQALYVACWIFHPVEKGSYMLRLESPTQQANVREAYDELLQKGELQSRISSHLGKRGASAHEGWNFLRGYKELLLQIEGNGAYLFLKCEGHPLEAGISGLKHLLSWGVKALTDAGKTASPELHNLAKDSSNVELRAAENFSSSFKSLQKQLGLSGEMVGVGEVIDGLWLKCGFNQSIPDNIKNNTHLLGRNMLGPTGYIAVFERQRDVLRKNGVKLTPEIVGELKKLATRLLATATVHTTQHYHEIRVTAKELTNSLTVFEGYTR